MPTFWCFGMLEYEPPLPEGEVGLLDFLLPFFLLDTIVNVELSPAQTGPKVRAGQA